MKATSATVRCCALPLAACRAPLPTWRDLRLRGISRAAGFPTEPSAIVAGHLPAGSFLDDEPDQSLDFPDRRQRSVHLALNDPLVEHDGEPGRGATTMR